MYKVKILKETEGRDYKIGDIVEISNEIYKWNRKEGWFETLEYHMRKRITSTCDKCGKTTRTWKMEIETRMNRFCTKCGKKNILFQDEKYWKCVECGEWNMCLDKITSVD